MGIFEYGFLAIYVVTSGGLFLYGMNCYVMIVLYLLGRNREEEENVQFLEGLPAFVPRVTTQLPIYNERFVVERLITAVVEMDYPPERHEIQVLDDSDDDTAVIAAGLIDRYRSQGVNIVHVRRTDRRGFKAGALEYGTTRAAGEFLAVFDADFIPAPDFLQRTIHFFAQDPRIALVQTRWGHVNPHDSLLTRAQSVGIDGHFVIEQGARTWNGLYMNFNGTAGVWRRSAIVDGGGWEADTLTEDLDLSYRVQLAGWRMKYLWDVVTPAELPVDINALKSQQYRWAKGSIQTAVKILPRVVRAEGPVFRKLQAVFHLTHYLIHPLMLASTVFSLPALLIPSTAIAGPLFLVTGVFLLSSALSPSVLYLVSQREAYGDWKRRIWILPVLVAIGVGIAVNNTRAVIEALLGRTSDFIRTPKYGATGSGVLARSGRGSGSGMAGARAGAPAGATLEEGAGTTLGAPGGTTAGTTAGLTAGTTVSADRFRSYRTSPELSVVLELAMAAYGFFSLYLYCVAGRWAIVPFLLLSSVGFLSVGLLSLRHGWRSDPRARRAALAPASR